MDSVHDPVARTEHGNVPEVEYAIVGGGVSGLYTAWRLLTHDKKAKVKVYEAGTRVGGRLLTWNPAGDTAGLRAELGGMRYLENQSLVSKLVPELGLAADAVEFHVKGPGLAWSLRGERMRAGDALAGSARYKLNPDEEGKPPDQLLKRVLTTVLNESGVKQPKDRKGWDEVKHKLKYRGVELWKIGFWNLIADVLSVEAYKYVVDSLGYYTLALNWNAAEALQILALDFAEDLRYKTLAKGFDQIPQTLFTKIKALAPDRVIVETRTRLRRFTTNADGSSTLHLVQNGAEVVVKAKHLVLAMPRRSLELLEPTSGFRPEGTLRKTIDSVRAYPAFKLFLFYEERWWEKLGFAGEDIKHGRSVSDMPIRQTYYLRPDNWEVEQPKSTREPYGLIMASYDDSVAVDFWRGLALPPKEQGQADEELVLLAATVFKEFSPLGGEPRNKWVKPLVLHAASPEMVRHAREQLAALHGVTKGEVPQPTLAAFADWSQDPFGGAWHFWEPQVDVRTTMPKVRKPIEGKNVYIVGEAYSGFQAWVEGAVTTAEHVLRDHLLPKKPLPQWLEKVYLGW